jgi:hypothetical protein
MSDYTLGKVEFERHADAVMTSLADSVVRHMAELEEANARIAVLEEEQKVLVRERDEALAAVTEGGTGNSGVERPEPSPHFSETVAFLRTFNRWRRGDETLEQPSPREVGWAIDAACDEIERLQAGGCARDQRTTQFCAEAVSAIQERDELRRERDEALVLAGGASTLRELANLHVEALLCWSTAERERDEERAITFRQADYMDELERERDEARAALLWAVEWLDVITGRFPDDGSVDEMFKELEKDRLTNNALDSAWNEVGWTQAVAKEVRG